MNSKRTRVLRLPRNACRRFSKTSSPLGFCQGLFDADTRTPCHHGPCEFGSLRIADGGHCLAANVTQHVRQGMFKEHLPAGQKAITACRQAFKGALKKSRPKGKQPSGQDNEVPALVRRAMEVCTASSEDFVHVKELDMQDPLLFSDEASFTRASAELRRGIEKMKSVSSQAKWLVTQIDKSKDGMTTAMAAYKPAVMKNLATLFTEHIPKRMTLDICVPSDCDTLRDDIFMPQAWAQAERHFSINVTPYGLTEVRYLTDGAYMVFAAKLEGLKGDTIKQKVEYVFTPVGQAAFMNACVEHGSNPG